MKKTWPFYIIIIAIISVITISITTNSTKTVDWSLSFNEQSKAPYGTEIFYKELPNLFKKQQINTVFYTPESYLEKKEAINNSPLKGNFLIVNNQNYSRKNATDALLNFAKHGNTVFISSHFFNEKFKNALKFNISTNNNKSDSLSHFYLTHNNKKQYILDKSKTYTYFTSIDTIRSKILGYAKQNNKHPNFTETPFGKGKIYIHLAPKAFTNYHILKDDNYKYVEQLISKLSNNDIHFDSYSKIRRHNVEKESNLNWFLSQKSFKWAWYTALFFAVLFVVFNAKRRQRIIKIIKPTQNTTIAFVKTVSSLYFDTKNHKNLIDKKIVYFLEKTRTDYNISTNKLDQDFITKLILKSGKDKTITTTLINYINTLKAKQTLVEQHLLTLNKHIESFYSN